MFRQPLSTTLAESDRIVAGLRFCAMRIIPIVQIIGAISMTVALVSYAAFTPAVVIAVFGLFLGVVFTLGVVSAIQLWRDGVSGRRYAIIHQAFLVPKIAVPGLIAYDIQDLPHFDVFVILLKNAVGGRFDTGFVFGEFTLQIGNPSPAALVLGVNLVPIAAILILRNWQDLHRRNKDIKLGIFN